MKQRCVKQDERCVKLRVLQLALREMRMLLREKRLWIAFGAIVALFVFTGPFGTFDQLGFIQRLGFWLTIHAATWLIALAGIALVSAWHGEGNSIGLPQTVLGCCLASPLIGVAVEVIKVTFLGEALTLSGVLWQMLQALPVAVVIGLVAYFFFQSGTVLANPPVPAVSENRLMLRLPPEKRGELRYMSMQDHYVEVVTAKGRELVLLRLADAIAEAGEGAGVQIHRSHWVAFSAIASVNRNDGKPVAVLKDATELPVSRTYLPALREAGFLPR